MKEDYTGELKTERVHKTRLYNKGGVRKYGCTSVATKHIIGPDKISESMPAEPVSTPEQQAPRTGCWYY